jgi:hypothetical protein
MPRVVARKLCTGMNGFSQCQFFTGRGYGATCPQFNLAVSLEEAPTFGRGFFTLNSPFLIQYVQRPPQRARFIALPERDWPFKPCLVASLSLNTPLAWYSQSLPSLRLFELARHSGNHI